MNKPEIFNLQPLFEDVQMQQAFPDGKTFVDCILKLSPEEINRLYILQKNNEDFNLNEFLAEHFDLPVIFSTPYIANKAKPVEEHIEELWTALTRQPDKESGSLIPLPYSYIVPGGRFGEIYYWDSYFTMLGLQASGRIDLIENMVNNFSHLIDTLGYIPNGNRTYYIGRSQPPFFSLMVKLLSEEKGEDILVKYLPQLEKEYTFWMTGAELLSEENKCMHRAVRMPDGEMMNRYWDANDTSRPESYREDVELAHQSEQDDKIVYRHLRAGAESGWDFSSRWFKDGATFTSIHTTDIVPVDLNCLLLHLEEMIGNAYQLKKNGTEEEKYTSLAIKRKEAIQKYCWNDGQKFYVDYNIEEKKMKNNLSAATAFPLFFNIANEQQAKRVAGKIQEKLLFAGGIITTSVITGQQWDAPNGWAPLHWMAIKGLENYGYHELAKDIAERWIKLNIDVYKRTGKLMEKYNVIDTKLEAGGGEYPGQDGFGWTNGVLLALIKKYGKAN
jgi:alpha,alpha-trehalase